MSMFLPHSNRCIIGYQRVTINDIYTHDKAKQEQAGKRHNPFDLVKSEPETSSHKVAYRRYKPWNQKLPRKVGICRTRLIVGTES